MNQTAAPHFEPLDPGRVNPMDPVELAYWCSQFGCEEDHLHQAVEAVGEHVTAVRDWLAQQRDT